MEMAEVEPVLLRDVTVSETFTDKDIRGIEYFSGNTDQSIHVNYSSTIFSESILKITM